MEEWCEDKAILCGLLFYCPGGADEFSPGFQTWETSNKAVALKGQEMAWTKCPSNATEEELAIC
jgi:hypothetical protein